MTGSYRQACRAVRGVPSPFDTDRVSRGFTRLSRFTNKRLLRVVTQAALTAATHHAESRLYYQKKLAGRPIRSAHQDARPNRTRAASCPPALQGAETCVVTVGGGRRVT